MFRKFLSLVLCLVVMMGVVVVPAGAADTTISLTFNPNGGSGNPYIMNNLTPGSIKLPTAESCHFTAPAGQEFSCWTIEQGGQRVTIGKPGDTYNFDNDTTVYASWELKNLTVSFNLNYINAPAIEPAQISVKYNDPKYTNAPENPTREGYDFGGWFQTKACTGTAIDLNASVAITESSTFYAKWEPQAVKVQLYYCYPDDASGLPNDYNRPTGNDPDKEFNAKYGEPYIYVDAGKTEYRLAAPAKPTNYQFIGWYTTEKDTAQIEGNKVEETDNINLSNHIVYARWKKTESQLLLKYNYPIGVEDDDFLSGAKPTDPPAETVTIGDKILDIIDHENLEPAFPKNYEFAGWYTTQTDQKTAGEIMDDESTVPNEKELTLYARWKYKITFLAGAEDAKVDGKDSTTRSYVIGSKYESLPTPKWAGQAFLGWFPSGSGASTNQVKANDIVNGTITELVAKWEEATYTLRFDPNGGEMEDGFTSEFNKDTKTYENLLPAKEIEPTRDNYSFAGWFTEKEKGTQVKADTKVTNLSDHTLYAHWTPSKHKVTFNLNYTGAPAGPAAKDVDYNSKLADALPSAAPTRTGYLFQGWLKNQTDRKSLVTDTDLVTADVTVYADWVSVNAMTLDPNGGTVTPTRIDIPGTDTVYPTLPTPTRAGYTFGGWTTTKNDENTKVASGGAIGDSKPSTLYAFWTANQYNVSFDGGTSSDPSPRKVTFGQRYGSLPSVHRGGYTFAGWFTQASGGTEVKSDTIVSTAQDHTLYAHWGFIIGFSANGGSGSMANVTAPANTPYSIPSCTFTPPLDKVFKCWAIGSPSGPQISGSSYTFTSATTLYAVWKDKPLTISASSNGGGSISPSGAVSVEAGEDQSFTARASDGYRLEHLYVDGEDFGPLESYTFRAVMEDHTIQAEFAPIDPPGYLTCGKNIYCPLAAYTDLNPREWYHDAVHFCMDNVIMNGTNVNVYSPNLPATRAMICKVLYQAEGCPDPFEGVLVQPYRDVRALDWHYPCITWATRAKVAEGYGNGNFGPNDPVTREQVVTLLWRYSGKPEPRSDTLNFFDAHLVHEYARKAMLWATENGIMNGKGNGILDPRGYAKRTEIAQIMLNFMG